MWEEWLKMAEDSQRAATGIESISQRFSVSRHYYAAYQAATALLHYHEQTPPAGRYSWNHQDTPDMVKQHLKDNSRYKLMENLKLLYKYRIYADYQAVEEISANDVMNVRKMSGFILKTTQEMLKSGRQ
jgi:uncharacterized protein (UPF0332 family)